MMIKKSILKSVDIKGFRGFNGTVNVNFDFPLVFLFGKNGVGKTSTLEAVEWGLYGDISDIMFKRFISRTKNELVNVFEKDINVKILLSHNGTDIPIERIKNRNKTKTIVQIPNIDEVNLEYFIHRLTGLSFSDFIRAVFLHQESIRSLLIEDADRDKAIDRLFGLEILSNILDSIPNQKINDLEKETSNKIETIQRELKARIDEVDKRIKNMIKDSRKNGIQESDIKIIYLESNFSQTLKLLGDLSKDVEIEKISISMPTSLEGFNDYTYYIEEQIKKIRRKIETKEALEIRKKLSKVADLQAEYNSLLSKNKISEKDLKVLIEKYGNLEELDKKAGEENGKITELKKEIENLEDSRMQLNSKYLVIKDAIKYFKDVDEDACPVCSKTIEGKDKLLKHLEIEYQKHKDEELEKIDRRITEDRSKIDLISGDIDNLNRRKDEINEKKEDIEKIDSDIKVLIIEEVSKKLEKTLTLDDDINSLLKAEISRLKKEIEKYNEPIKEREGKLDIIEDKKVKINIVCNILLEKERLKNLEKVNREEFAEINKILREITDFKNTLDTVSESVREIQVSQSSDMIKKSLPLIKEFYKKLVQHPFYSEIEIERETINRGGKIRNKYYIKCFNPKYKEETGASQRLSTGQMNCVAISIYLALAKLETMSHNLGFLLMDDPAQSLDTDHKKALAGILKELSKEKQLIIATHDNEFQEILKESFKTLKPVIYEFGKWTEKGPDIQLIK